MGVSPDCDTRLFETDDAVGVEYRAGVDVNGALGGGELVPLWVAHPLDKEDSADLSDEPLEARLRILVTLSPLCPLLFCFMGENESGVLVLEGEVVLEEPLDTGRDP